MCSGHAFTCSSWGVSYLILTFIISIHSVHTIPASLEMLIHWTLHSFCLSCHSMSWVVNFSDHEFREVLLPSLSLVAYGIFSVAEVLIWHGLIKCLDRTDDFIIIMKLYQSYMICVPLVYTLEWFLLAQSSFHVLFTNWDPLWRAYNLGCHFIIQTSV